MKKILTKMAIVVAATSVVWPATGCTFNFYVDQGKAAMITSFANQTSNVVKALVLGKEKQVDTDQTINDIFRNYPNSSISNVTNTFNTIDNFTQTWGENQQISFNGFDGTLNNYFVPHGTGALTKTVNAYQSTNDTLSSLNYISALGVADNPTIYNQFEGNKDLKNTITSFLNQTKTKDPTQASSLIRLLKNTIVGTDWNNPTGQQFGNNVLVPMTSALNYLADGAWSDTQLTTPTTPADFANFMANWKDPQGNYYSQWATSSGFDLSSSYYNPWNQNDFNIYRAGTLINYLFFKIGQDYQIAKPGGSYKKRYLGDIISDHLTEIISGNLTDLLTDLQQYLAHILDNPLYLITIFHAVIPLIKAYILQAPDLTTGFKNLTFGNLYPTDANRGIYNFQDIINNIFALLNNPTKLRNIIKVLLGWTEASDRGALGHSFLYDIKVNIFIGSDPLGYLMSGQGAGSFIPESTKNDLIDQVMNAITGLNITDILNSINRVYGEWVQQYNSKGLGINLDIDQLKDFLVKPTTGLLSAMNDNLAPVLYDIFNDATPIDPNTIDPVDAGNPYNKFYVALGGQLPAGVGQAPPTNFTINSVLFILKNNIGNINSPLGQIVTIGLGNSTQGIQGIFTIIINNNKAWINDNYTKYFDPTNVSLGKINNPNMTTTVTSGVITNTLTYNFDYTINNQTYQFYIACVAHEQDSSFTGTQVFHFTQINLRKINS